MTLPLWLTILIFIVGIVIFYAGTKVVKNSTEHIATKGMFMIILGIIIVGAGLLFGVIIPFEEYWFLGPSPK